MAARSTKSKPFTPIENDSKKITIPFPKTFNIIYFLGFLLVIAAFLLGMLVTKVQYLEEGAGAITANEDDITTGDEVPVGPVDVSDGELPEMSAEIYNNVAKPNGQNEKLKIVEFSDFQCPYCKGFWEDALAEIKKEYVETGKAEFSYRHYPLKEIHPNAQKAAEASECASEQGNFWGYHDELFKNQADWEALSDTEAQTKFAEYANNLGLNGASLAECVSSGKMKPKVDADLADGEAAGVDGTPATFINGILISGAAPYADFKAEIEKQLAELKN